MSLYYEKDGITIHHGDCREILPGLAKVDLVLTDPPYGLGDKMQGGTWGNSPMYEDMRRWDAAVVSEATILQVVAMGSHAIVWGGNCYPMPPSRCWLSWFKLNNVPTTADFELAWTTFDRPSKAARFQVHDDGRRAHPTQKPSRLMSFCIAFAGEPQTILDPFMGSGTTLIAARSLGRKAIGIEIEERYCEIAAKRLDQALLPFEAAP